VKILLVYPCVFGIAQTLTHNEYAAWKKRPFGVRPFFPRLAYMEVGKGA